MQRVGAYQLFQSLLKPSQPRRLLDSDVDSIYIGLAISNIDNTIASPLSVLTRTKTSSYLTRTKTDIDLMASEFKKLISDHSLVGFVVGNPYGRYQRLGPIATQVKVLINDLSNTGHFDGLEYTYYEEDFTSRNVELLLDPLNVQRVAAKRISDKLAAVQILQTYLDDMNKMKV